MIISPGVTIGGAITIADPTIPTQGNVTSWTDSTFANIAGNGSGYLSSSLSATNQMCWQLFYAERTVIIPAQANGLGLSVYAGDSNSWTWWITVGAIPGINNFYSNPAQIGSGTCSASTTGLAGAFVPSTTTVSTTIPAGSYFMIGVTGGPYYRTFQNATQNNTFTINGVPYVTALNTVYYSPYPSGPTAGVPTQVGGTTAGYTTYTGNITVLSVVFQ